MPFKCSCGCTCYLKSQRVSGWWKTLHDENDSIDNTDLSGLTFGPEPKTVVCADCMKRRPNPAYTEQQAEIDDATKLARRRVRRII